MKLHTRVFPINSLPPPPWGPLHPLTRWAAFPACLQAWAHQPWPNISVPFVATELQANTMAFTGM